MTLHPAVFPLGSSRRTRVALALLFCAAATVLVACGDSEDQGRSGYFTIQLWPAGPGGPTSGTDYYIPVTGTSYRTDPRFAPCGVVEVSFSGIALAAVGGSATRVPDDAEQESEAAVRYVGNADFSLCGSDDHSFQAEFTYQGVRYLVGGTVLLPFGDYQSIVPGGDWVETCEQYAENLQEETGDYSVCFWPYEYAPPAPATARTRPQPLR